MTKEYGDSRLFSQLHFMGDHTMSSPFHSGHTLMPQRHSGHSHPHPMGQVPSALSSLGGLQSQARAPSLLKIPTIKLHSRASWVGGSISKQLACNMGYPGLIPGSGRSPGEGNDNPLQYSCLENPMDSGAWQATVHEVERAGHDFSN